MNTTGIKGEPDYKVTIQKDKGAKIGDNLFGLFFEDINYAADGGILAEMIENGSFEFRNKTEFFGDYGWSLYGGEQGSISISEEYPMNENQTHCLIFETDGKTGLKNKAYDGIYMKKGENYRVSLYAVSRQPILAGIYKGDKCIVSAALTEESRELPSCVAAAWKKYS